jgi:photosystem II stability/assembly factor-like uncharacterized protein
LNCDINIENALFGVDSIIERKMKMKNTILICCLFIVVFTACKKETLNYEWKDISIPYDIELTAIHMVDDENGYVGGYSGIIIEERITHLGEVPSPYGDTLVYLADDADIFVEHKFKPNQQIYPILYKTTNGGASWKEINTPFKIGIIDIQFIDKDYGFVVTSDEGVFKTTDGGETWIKILGNRIHVYYGWGFNNTFDAVSFLDKNYGFAYGSKSDCSLLLATQDGGLTWSCISLSYMGKTSEKYPTLFHSINTLEFCDSKETGYLVNNRDMYKTLNQGASWEKIYGAKYPIEPIFYNTSTIFLPTERLFTSDGGTSWHETPLFHYGDKMVTPNLSDFYYLFDYRIRKTVSGEQKYYDMSVENKNRVTGLFFTSENVGYAIGSNSLVLKYNRKEMK